jgi:hypothetical protein
MISRRNSKFIFWMFFVDWLKFLLEYLQDIWLSFTWWLVKEEVSFVLKCFCEIWFLIVNILVVVAAHQRALVVAHCSGGKQEYCLAANIWNLKKIVLVFSVLNKRMVSFDGMEWNGISHNKSKQEYCFWNWKKIVLVFFILKWLVWRKCFF